jgi:diphosphomevalonate decarboxylase
MSYSSATARAGANIALVKYWGKRDAALNLPASGSISITLDALQTQTTLHPEPHAAEDRLLLNGQSVDAGRASRVLGLMRDLAGGGPAFRIESRNDFPTGAGLASSASAFAALVVAADRALNLGLPSAKLSELARRGSGSAARSIFGGFVEWAVGESDDGHDSIAQPLLAAEAWPLKVVVAITDSQAKAVSSTDGMNRTMATSPYYPDWLRTVPADLDLARTAIARQEFDALAEVAEHSALKMHASALAARPGILYWNPATLACIEAIRALRRDGHAVFFTIDAGPQVKAVCLPDAVSAVAARLAAVDGVVGVIESGLGAGAEVLA